MHPSIRNQQPPIGNLQSSLQFSQGSLQDYVGCKRCFQLRYLLKLAWPALEAEPVLEYEAAMQQGALFHRLIQQNLLGIPVERLSPLAKGPDLSRWWQNYLEFGYPPRVALYPEITLSMPILNCRLVAKYDGILVTPEGQAIIYDWKTSRRRPKRSWLVDRLQSRVYPYLLAQAGAHLNQGKPFLPEQIDMIYWFAESPGEPEKLPYNAEAFARDEAYLKSLIDEITHLDSQAFTMTQAVDRCRFCTYRSLCDRGVTAGTLDEIEAEPEPVAEPWAEADFDFDQIAEIAF